MIRSLATLAALAALDLLPLEVHEWGTFTALQDETGRAIGGINTDDEPVPGFVHRLADLVLLPPGVLPRGFFKWAPACHPDVTLRLETPVVYFHPAPDAPDPLAVDVRVAFRGGWLTEFYPDAEAGAPGLPGRDFPRGRIAPSAVGTLAWSGLAIGGAFEPAFPATDEPVWLAPRRVDAADVLAANGEAERFLFYRGVGNRDAPLRVVREGETLVVRSQAEPELVSDREPWIRALWLFDARPDGTVAWRRMDAAALGPPGEEVARTAARFDERIYSLGALAALRDDMRGELVADGLHLDEAEALLATWSASYFESHGLRLFFLLPRAWTDAVLPLEVLPRARIERTMVGRIEIVTPRQRAILRGLAAGPPPSRDWFDRGSMQLMARSRTGFFADWTRLVEGELTLEEAGFRPPEDVQAYVELGRFRNALVLDELARRPSPRLAEFVRVYGLGPVPEAPPDFEGVEGDGG